MSTPRGISSVPGYVGPCSLCAQCTSLGGVSLTMLAIPRWALSLLCGMGLPSYLVMRKNIFCSAAVLVLGTEGTPHHTHVFVRQKAPGDPSAQYEKN